MAQRGRGRGRPRSAPDPSKLNRTARVGELIRRILAESFIEFDDDRLMLVSITSVDVDRDFNRAIVWLTTLDLDDEPAALEALEEYKGALRKAVSQQARLRKTPALEFRPDGVVRSAERIEQLLRSTSDGEGADPESPTSSDDGSS